MVEILKTKNSLNLTLVKNLFTERDVKYILRSKNHLQLPNAKTAKYGIENIQYINYRIYYSTRVFVNLFSFSKRKVYNLFCFVGVN